MSDATLAIIMLSVIVVGLAAHQVMRWLSRRRWLQHEELAFLREEGFEPLSDRWLIDTRIVRYTGRRHGLLVRVESGSGPSRTYARAAVEFPSGVPIGVRISSEHDEGLLTRVLRLREVEIGLHHFDSQFILLSRDEERLKSLLEPEMRQMLMSLRERVRDVRLDEDGVHINVSGQVSPGDFLQLIDDAVRLGRDAHSKAVEILSDERDASSESSVFTPIPGALEAIEGPTP